MAAVEADLPTRGVVRWIIVAVAALVLLADIATNLLTPESRGTVPQQFLAAYLASAFALFAWRPRFAAAALLLGVPLGLWANDVGMALLVATVCVGAVVATTGRRVMIGFLVAYAAMLVVIAALRLPSFDIFDVLTSLLLACASFAVGLAVRRVRGNEQALAERVAHVEAMLAAAKREERERIADELHDLIIRDLTVIAMHARVLERSNDPEQVASSRGAIASSSRHALGDLRRVLRLARTEGGADRFERGVELLAPALDAVGGQLGAMGVELELDVAEGTLELLDPAASASFARALREAAANIIKHAPGSPRVVVRLAEEGRNVVLDIDNAPGTRTSDGRGLPDGGYGLARMTERFGVLGGGVSAGPAPSGGWRLRAHLPR